MSEAAAEVAAKLQCELQLTLTSKSKPNAKCRVRFEPAI